MHFDNDGVVAGAINEKDLSRIREAVCIQVEKIYDSCREKDCIENAKVLFRDQQKIQWIINRAINVKLRRAEVVDVFTDIEPVPFKRGFYTVDIKFFIKVTLDFFLPRDSAGARIVTVPGIILFDKKVILFGSEGNAKIFKSSFVEDGIDKKIKGSLQQDNLPIAKVEVVEPIALNAKIQDPADKFFEDCCVAHLPRSIEDLLEDEVVYDFDDVEMATESRQVISRRVVASVGLFSIIKLVRFVQLLIPAFDFCVPARQCISATEANPCELFETIAFPVDEFFPPQKRDFPGALAAEKEMAGEMKDKR
ncbi:MAG TPA: hypothetical protein GXX20_11485 [Clostridiaceae bacterium]|nr:hypothetical protein [Clostridiaceae bacterium]